jgi:hypothetical protein
MLASSNLSHVVNDCCSMVILLYRMMPTLFPEALITAFLAVLHINSQLLVFVSYSLLYQHRRLRDQRISL